MNRRGFLTGLIAAPLVVSYQNIMPVKLFAPEVLPFDPAMIPIIRKTLMDGFIHDILSVQPMWNNPDIVEAVNALTGRNYPLFRVVRA